MKPNWYFPETIAAIEASDKSLTKMNDADNKVRRDAGLPPKGWSRLCDKLDNEVEGKNETKGDKQ